MGFFDALDSVENKKEQEIVKVAAESISNETEREFCLWVKPTEKGWEQLLGQRDKSSLVVDLLLPTKNGRRRVRIKDGVANLTLKRWTSDGTKEEHSELGTRTALSMFDISPNIHIFTRISYEAPEFKERAGGKSEYDIDLFCRPGVDLSDAFSSLTKFNGMVEDINSAPLYTEWVKVELEVAKFFDIKPSELIPFEFEEYMSSRPKDEEGKAEISHYWDVVTNHA